MKRLLLLALLISGAAHAQTTVWSCMTNCSASSNTYNDGAFRAPSPAPNYVATTSGTQTDCSRNWWNTAGAVRWRRPADLQGAWCVARKVGSVESFAPASSFGWPNATPVPVDCVVSTWSACSLVTGKQTRSIVTAPANGGAACPALEQPCPPPVPSVSVLVTIDRNPILIGESVTVTWSSTNAASCSSSWAPSVPFASSASLGPFTFAQDVELGVTCRNFFGDYGAFLHLIVTPPPPKSPGRWPHLEDFLAAPGSMAKVQWDFLETTGTKYSIKSTWFWKDAAGQVHQEAWATTITAALRRANDEQNGGSYSEDEARAECEEACEILPPGPLKDELDAYARQFTVEQLGLVE